MQVVDQIVPVDRPVVALALLETRCTVADVVSRLNEHDARDLRVENSHHTGRGPRSILTLFFDRELEQWVEGHGIPLCKYSLRCTHLGEHLSSRVAARVTRKANLLLALVHDGPPFLNKPHNIAQNYLLVNIGPLC